MKPILLRFSGLHSYRTKQTVDFMKLCQGGLFGIFGPTGSGKSTVLDAITLALYARVDRAGGDRRGILNHNEDVLFVDFTFETGVGKQRTRYRVERQYKRSGAHNVHVTYSRLMVCDAADQKVLADKDNDVTKRIVEIIGLDFHDFTRAVVLPQGKFAQFLTMKPAERRRMLERLFALEAYGKHLTQRINTRRERVVNTLHHIDGELAGLHDATEEHVAKWQHQVQQAEETLHIARSKRKRIQKQYAVAEQKHALQQKVARVEQSLAPLLRQEAEVKQWQHKLRMAEKAEPLRRDLHDAEQAETTLNKVQKEVRQLVVQKEEAAQQCQYAQQQFDAAQKKRQQQERTLHDRRSRLEQGLADEKELHALQEQLTTYEQQLAMSEEKVSAAKTAYESMEKQFHDSDKALHRLKEKVENLAVDTQWRAVVSDAVHVLQRLSEAHDMVKQREKTCLAAWENLLHAQKQAETVQGVFQTEQSTLQQLENELSQLQTVPATDHDALQHDPRMMERTKSCLHQLVTLTHDTEENEKALRAAEKKMVAMQQTYEQAKQKLEQAEHSYEQARNAVTKTQHAAARYAFATSLAEGVPCPVCGSNHHPAPALQQETTHDEALAYWQQTEAHYIAAQQRVAHIKAQLAAAETDYNQLMETRNRLAQRICKQRDVLPEAWRSLCIDKLQRAVTEAERAYEQREQHIHALQTEIEEQQQRVAEATDRVATARDTLLTANTQYKSAKTHEHEATAYEEQMRKTLRNIIGNHTAAAMQQAWHTIQEAESQIVLLQQQIKTRQTEVQQLQTEKEKTHEQLEATQNQHSTLLSEMQPIRTKIQHLTEKLHDVADGRSVQPLLQAVEDQLQELTATEQSRRTAYEKTQQNLAVYEQQLAVAEERVRTNDRLLAKAREQMQAALHSAGFSSIQEVTDALLPDEARAELNERITAYEQQRQQLEQEKQHLVKQIGDDWLSDEDWERIRANHKAAEENFEQASAHFAQAQTSYDDTCRRHERWASLQQERSTVQKQKDRLDQLAQLCRGNRFVEFVAEEYLSSVVVEASQRLGTLTRHRYALEIDADMGFVIRDDSNGGVRRPVSSLSGGETFLTSLALALALSNQIQLHGTQPLEFFFLDEGFGSLDPNLLETVMTALEHLQAERLHIGVISHVPELRQRISHRLLVETSESNEEGSTLRFERA